VVLAPGLDIGNRCIALLKSAAPHSFMALTGWHSHSVRGFALRMSARNELPCSVLQERR
jgi:hypothetical protein